MRQLAAHSFSIWGGCSSCGEIFLVCQLALGLCLFQIMCKRSVDILKPFLGSCTCFLYCSFALIGIFRVEGQGM